jgi:uncharacterized protein
VIIDSSHRPWPVPARPFSVAMVWHELLFIHHRVDARALRPLVPAGLEIDTFDGSAWLAVVPFRMSRIRPRGLPAVPWLSNFAELNVRTYVTRDDKPGVWFFSLDAANPIAVAVARRTFHLPYFCATMQCRRDPTGEIDYASRRTHRGQPPLAFAARYRPTGPIAKARPGSIDHFLTERYCLYAAASDGRLFRGDITHAPWPLQPAEADITQDTMTTPLGIDVPNERPLLHYADRLDVTAWKAERV